MTCDTQDISLLSPLVSFPSSTLHASRWWYSARSLSASGAPVVTSWQSSSAGGRAVGACRSLTVPGRLSQWWPAWRSTSSAELLFLFLLVRPVKELSDCQRTLHTTKGINFLLWCLGFGRTSCTCFSAVTQPAGRGWYWFCNLLSDRKLRLETREHISEQDYCWWNSRSRVWMPSAG